MSVEVGGGGVPRGLEALARWVGRRRAGVKFCVLCYFTVFLLWPGGGKRRQGDGGGRGEASGLRGLDGQGDEMTVAVLLGEVDVVFCVQLSDGMGYLHGVRDKIGAAFTQRDLGS